MQDSPKDGEDVIDEAASENDLPDEVVFRMWDEAEPVELVPPVRIVGVDAWQARGQSETVGAVHSRHDYRSDPAAWTVGIEDDDESRAQTLKGDRNPLVAL